MKVRKFNGHVLPPYVYVKKKTYLYFIKGDLLVNLPNDLSGPEFYAAYTECLKGGAVGGSNRTFEKLAVDYMASNKYKKLATNTQNSYRLSINWIVERCGKTLVKKMTRKQIIAMRDSRKDTPTAANKNLLVMVVLLEHALDLDWVQINVARGVSKIDHDADIRLPWSEEEVEKFHEHADPRSSLLLELCIATGQRLNDVLGMRWSDVTTDPVAGYGIFVTQQKTGAKVFIPFSDRLQSIIQRLSNQIDQKGSDFIVVNQQYPSKKLTTSTVQKQMGAIREKIGVTKTLHDLRHTCAHRLAERGLTNEVIMSITGHGSAKMVNHYCAAAAQRRRAADAIKAMNEKEAA